MEAEIGVILVEDGGRGHKPRNTGSHYKLKTTWKQVLL